MNNSNEKTSCSELFITSLINSKSDVNIFLQNGIKLSGKILDHDKDTLILFNNKKSQLVYKTSISTILPN